MARYLIFFASEAMVVSDVESKAVGSDSHAAIDEAKAVGVYVFRGGIDEEASPVPISTDGTFIGSGHPILPGFSSSCLILTSNTGRPAAVS